MALARFKPTQHILAECGRRKEEQLKMKVKSKIKSFQIKQMTSSASSNDRNWKVIGPTSIIGHPFQLIGLYLIGKFTMT